MCSSDLIGTASSMKSSMAGNKLAAMRQQQEEKEKQKALKDTPAEMSEQTENTNQEEK